MNNEKWLLILYSSPDNQYVEQLQQHLSVLEEYDFNIDTAADPGEIPGENGDQAFESSLDRAAGIILIVSKSFLQSGLMKDDKLKKQLKQKQEGGIPMIFLPVNDCQWKRIPWLKKIPHFPGGDKFLADMDSQSINQTLARATTYIASKYNLSARIEAGILGYLEINWVGPARKFIFEPNPRLNIITGDNSLGKTFLLECIWLVLSGTGPSNLLYPRRNAPQDDTNIIFRLMTKSGLPGQPVFLHYDWQKRLWPAAFQTRDSSSIVVYARYDDSFSVWDPLRAKVALPDGAKRSLSPLVFSKAEIFDGIYEEIPGRPVRYLCSGMRTDWIDWQKTENSPFAVFEKILEKLSANPEDFLKPGKPVKIPGDDRLIPTLQYAYDNQVPVTTAAASVQRILSLAYLLLWVWESHKSECEKSRQAPYRQMVILVDEIESHLHMQWQRSILPALCEVKNILDKEMDIQFIITTHSPAVLASVETIFNEDDDRLFHLDIKDRGKGEVILETLPFERTGCFDDWTMSKLFGLKQARSIEAEKAIEDAKKLQERDAVSDDEVKKVHDRLVSILGDFDDFWPRWLYFAEQHHVGDTADDPGRTPD